MGDTKNLILAIVLSMAVLFVFQSFFGEPPEEVLLPEETQQAEDNLSFDNDALTPGDELTDPAASSVNDNISEPATAPGNVARPDPVMIEAVRLRGSISPVGVRLDNLILNDYYNEVGEQGGNVVLFRPETEESAYFAEFNWRANSEVELPTKDTVWQTSGNPLTLETPVEFSWENRQGIIFKQIISIDENYLFTIRQIVTNNSGVRIQVAPVGQITRLETPDTLGFFIMHEGPIGFLGGELYDRSDDFTYDDLKELFEDEPNPLDKRVEISGVDGWLGFVDKYWVSAIVPDQSKPFKARYFYSQNQGRDQYVSSYLTEAGTELAVNQTIESLTYLFAGAKEVDLVDAYEKDYNIPKFDLVVDWGWFYFLTKPIFYGLEFIAKYVGNVGVSILILTVFIKLLLFPLANKSYRSMSRMKKLQPKIKQVRERYGDDKLKIQQETMALYKKEKVNPASGCLPIFVQIPVFFALYKVLFVTIEMRHQPFFGWIQDLAAPDRLTFITGFGLFPWDAPGFLLIGIWPIVMGLTMWLQMKLNPQSPDPIQAKIFTFMPIVFTFILAPFPAGLVIYWTWNNILSITQQWVIMRKEGITISDVK
ncbi:MAG: membrane protein insertase YidC [Alphaproteobacteria bacterium]